MNIYGSTIGQFNSTDSNNISAKNYTNGIKQENGKDNDKKGVML